MVTRDANLDLSPAASDLPLIATNKMSGSTLDLEGTPLHGMAVRLDVGYTAGNTAVLTGTLDVIVHAASSTPVASSDPVVGQLEEPLVMSSETAGTTLQRIIPFVTEKRYVACEFALTTVASDSPSWSQVEAFAVLQVGLEWDRQVNFH